MKVLVVGYYNKGNLGDDAYQGIMGRFFPKDNLTFVCANKVSTVNASDYDAVVVGGGDIINDYFNDHISPFLRTFKGPKIAFSIGIPFPSCITEKYLGHFDHVFTRNYEDLREIQKVLGSHKAHFIPDIALAYEPSKGRINTSNDLSVSLGSVQNFSIGGMTEKKCGVFLVGNLINYPSIVDDIAHLIGKIALTYSVTLYCFDPAEDRPLSEKVRDLALQRISRAITNKNRIIVNSESHTAQEMINIMTDLDFAVCMRYHSHIFCTIAGTPFMSISSTRKTRSYMKQSGLNAYQYEIELDGYGTPVKSDYDAMREICRHALRNRKLIKDQMEMFLKQSRFLLSNRQASRLISINNSDIRQGVARFIEETGDYQNGARLLSNYVIGYPDSPYVWGMYEKFKDAKDDLLDVVHDSVQYLTHYGAVLKNEFIELFGGNKTLPLYVDLTEYQTYKGAHRGGWYVACEELYKRNSKNPQGEPNGIICDMYVDRTFHWANSYMSYRGVIPYTSPWCGFIHHTADTTYSSYNTDALFDNNDFIQSLHTCVALFSLSEPLSRYLRNRLSTIAPHIKVITFAHPVVDPIESFSIRGFSQNKDRKLVNVGAWMRNPFTLYRIPKIPLKKAILVGKEMNDHLPPDNFRIAYAGPDPYVETNNDENTEDRTSKLGPLYPCRPKPNSSPRWIIMLNEWLLSQGIKTSHYKDGVLYIFDEDRVNELNSKIQAMIKDITPLKYQSNEEYDDLLSKNVVFLDLVDAAAVNTIIECIVRRTPIVINKIPGTVALLGEHYPLFYKDVSEIPKLVSERAVNQAHQYLRRLDIKRFRLTYFLDQMTEVITDLTK